MRQFILMSILMMLTSCSLHSQELPTPQTNQQNLNADPLPVTENESDDSDKTGNWELNGKIGVQTSRNSTSATVNWSQRGSHYTLSLQGPVGTPGMVISGAPGNAVLKTSDGKTYKAKTPEQLLSQHWGYQFPLSSLYYWVRGLPVPNRPAKTSYNKSHKLNQLTQQGWHINYLSYTKIGNEILPNRIYAYSSSLTTKVVIYQWNISK